MPVLKKYNKNFFKTWTPDMAYVLGFLFADGSLTETKRGTHFISFHTLDRELLVAMQKSFDSDHMVSKRSVRSGQVYRLQIGSKEWFSDLQRIGMRPAKGRHMLLPDVPSEYIGHYVRGYFDGDGNVWSGSVHKERTTQTPVLQVSFTSASHRFLHDLLSLLRLQGVQGGSLFRSKSDTYSRLSFSTKDALQIYQIMYNAGHKLCLVRKKCVFDRFVKERKTLQSR